MDLNVKRLNDKNKYFSKYLTLKNQKKKKKSENSKDVG